MRLTQSVSCSVYPLILLRRQRCTLFAVSTTQIVSGGLACCTSFVATGAASYICFCVDFSNHPSASVIEETTEAGDNDDLTSSVDDTALSLIVNEPTVDEGAVTNADDRIVGIIDPFLGAAKVVLDWFIGSSSIRNLLPGHADVPFRFLLLLDSGMRAKFMGPDVFLFSAVSWVSLCNIVSYMFRTQVVATRELVDAHPKTPGRGGGGTASSSRLKSNAASARSSGMYE